MGWYLYTRKLILLNRLGFVHIIKLTLVLPRVGHCDLPLIFPGSTKTQKDYAKKLLGNCKFILYAHFDAKTMGVAWQQGGGRVTRQSQGVGVTATQRVFSMENAQNALLVTSNGKCLQYLYFFLFIWTGNLSSFIFPPNYSDPPPW